MRPDGRIAPAPRDSEAPLYRRIFQILSDRIITFQIKPLEPLSELRIAQDLGVSRTPTREALLRLADIGLVDIFPQRGTRVSPLRRRDLESSQFMREAMEIALLRRAFERGFPEGILRGLQAEIAIQEAMARLDNAEQFYASDERFHAMIADAAGLAQVVPEIDRAKIHMDRMRRLMISGIEHLPQIIAQHSAIVAAIAARDLAGADAAMTTHLRRVLHFVDQAVERHPEYFEQADRSGSGLHPMAAARGRA